MNVPDPVRSVIERFTPSEEIPPEACLAAKRVVLVASPSSVARAKAFLFASTRLFSYCASVGMELDQANCLRLCVIERFLACGTHGMSHATLRTIRSNLLALSRALPGAPTPQRSWSRERSKRPYRPQEIAGFLAMAHAQPTVSRRMRSGGLICLGAGAGLVGADLKTVRGTDVSRSSGGVIVSVGGRRPRRVPVLARYAAPLEDAARFAGDGFVTGGGSETRRNVTYPLISSLAQGEDLGRLDVSRLRATWLTEVAEGIGLRAFMTAAGITCSQRLGDLVAQIDEPSLDQAVSLLGATL